LLSSGNTSKTTDKVMSRKQRRGFGPPGANSPAALFNAAVAHHQTGALIEAERQYRHILSLAPNHADTLHNLGVIALQRGDAAAAVDLIGKAIAANDRVAEYHYNIALAWRALDRTDKVATHLERAIALRPDHALAQLNLGNVRREQGRAVDAIACYERAISRAPALAAAHFNLANVLAEQGRWDAATAQYARVLAIEPNHVEAHAAVGAALMAQYATAESSAEHNAAREAIPHLEYVATAARDFPSAYANLAKAYMAAGEQGLAVHAAARAIEHNETEEGRLFFAQCVRRVRFTAEDKRLRVLLLRAIREGWARPRDLANAGISMVRLNSAVADLIVRVNAAWPGRLETEYLFGRTGIAALMQDQLLCALLEDNAVIDVGLERVFTNVRHGLLARAKTDELPDERMLAFCCAVARQCFINQYVYAQTDTEAEAARQLREALDRALAAGRECPALWPVVVGAYFPLHKLPHGAALLDRAWPQCVRDLLIQQIEEPAEERCLAAATPALTVIDSAISQAVREQYEENPYPRWVKAGPPLQPAILGDHEPNRSFHILIAGCGTGLSTAELARRARQARILAIDLSLASLGYAKRMAQNLSISNVEFAQADIMALGAIGRTFDFIDVSGVLHHLADPWAGWRVLLSLLRPGGVMQVGLYSELARQNVVAARALIAARQYRPIPEDIRRCRQDIIMTDDAVMKSLTLWGDFFSTDECRDLLFHVQEHRIDMPQIKAFLAANGVQFAGFILDSTILQRFAARFPGAAAMLDLDCWHSFESEAPDTFAGMYQFWVRKP
jgi:tetratricopeptide (TPR) repeat protein/SAM-dependent methyltransferase